jgi:hypothetical protein
MTNDINGRYLQLRERITMRKCHALMERHINRRISRLLARVAKRKAEGNG